MNIYSIVKKIFFLHIIVILVLLVVFIIYPHALQKTQTIKFVENISSLIEYDTTNLDLKIDSIFKSLPTIQKSNNAILSQDRISLFLKGYGDCSSNCISFGALLQNFNKKYLVIHLLPKNKSCLLGNGHTIFQTFYHKNNLVLDIYSRQLVVKKNTGITNVNTLNESSKVEYALINLNSKNREMEVHDWYKKNTESAIGIVLSKEYANYFKFINKIYTIKSHSLLAKSIYHFIALLFNKLPIIYIDKKHESDFKKIQYFQLSTFLGSFFILLFKILPFSLLLLLFLKFKK